LGRVTAPNAKGFCCGCWTTWSGVEREGQLTDEQKTALTSIGAQALTLACAPAGTGKTHLAVEAGQLDHLEGWH
jgi:hypothetical protein